MDSDKENFIKAVQEDEHAELDIGKGYTLVTDWEGDGTFNPSVEASNVSGDDGQEILELLNEIFEVTFWGIEYSDSNDCYYPYCEEKPSLSKSS